MRIVFCGSGTFATPALDAVRTSDHELVRVITQPPRRAGRGGPHRATPVAQAARQAGLDVVECPDINAADVVRDLAAREIDVLCVADFGQMIRADARKTARRSAFNLHASLLPELRGAAPIQWAILRGFERTGVTTFELVDRMDAGAIYLQAETRIEADETADELRARLASLGADVVRRTLDAIASGHPQARPQDEARATRAPRLSKSDGVIDFAGDAASIRNRIHGTWPWPGGQAVLRRADAKDLPVVIARAQAEPAGGGDPGRIGADGRVSAGRGSVRIVELRPAGRRRMPWRDFVNGYRVREGDRFVAPER
jgi:methionyl-tRNA formyltransferase